MNKPAAPLLTSAQARTQVAAILTRYDLASAVPHLTPQAFAALVRQAKLTLTPDQVEVFGTAHARSLWEENAIATTAAPYDYDSPADYRKACATLATALQRTGLFTAREIKELADPMSGPSPF